MKRLGLAAARQCETATHSRCRCRCKGVLHGKMRGDSDQFFAGLSDVDPHYALPKGKKPERPLPLFDGEL